MLVLVRHGETTANAEGRLSGRGEVALTEAGRRQVSALAGALGPVVRLISSPLGRAVETAEGLATGRPVEIDDRWTEIDYGQYEGLRLSEVPAELWTRWRTDPGHQPPGGESLSDVRQRVTDACEELFADAGVGARSGDGDVVVVSHVSPIKAAITWALGIGDAAVWRMHLSTGSMCVIGWSGESPMLETYNWRRARSQPEPATTLSRTR